MYKRTATMTLSRTLVNAMVAALVTRPAAALLTTPKVRLYTNNVAPTPDSVYADFTAAVFSGYADVALTLSGPVNIGNDVQGEIGTAVFTATTATPFVGATIIGYAITDGATTFYGGEQFAEPVPIGAAGDFLQVDVVLPMSCYEDAPV